jgi:transcriptional regulator with XRE-family HTH domain
MPRPPKAPTSAEAARLALARRIAEARAKAGHENAAEFARIVGVTPNTVYRWEKSEVTPEALMIPAIASACRVTCDWLLTGKQPTSRALDPTRKLEPMIERAVDRGIEAFFARMSRPKR